MHCLALIIISLGCLAAAANHNAVYKSALRARGECVKYRNAKNLTLIATPLRSDQESTCVCRCELIKLGLWNDCVGQLEVPSDQYYTSDPGDRCYRERKRQCVKQRMTAVDPSDQCSKAFVFYKCYNDQYGTVNLDRVGVVPFSDLQHEQILRDCVEMLQLSNYDVNAIANNPLMISGNSKCLLRCFLVREGLYSDCEGPNSKSLFVQFAKKNDFERYERRLQHCYSRVNDEGWDYCTLATRFVLDCLGDNATAVEKVLAALGRISWD